MLIKGLLFPLFLFSETAGNPEWAKQPRLTRSGSESQRRTWFNLPGASLIINMFYVATLLIQTVLKSL